MKRRSARIIFISFVTAALALGSVGCGTAQSWPPKSNVSAPAASEKPTRKTISGTGKDYLSDAFSSPEYASILLPDDEKNHVIAPTSITLALAMAAEAASGESRAQILNVLGADNMENVREKASILYGMGNFTMYNDTAEGQTANSIWMSNLGYTFNNDILSQLNQSLFADFYTGNVSSKAFSKQMQSWMNEHTNGLLQDNIESIEMTSNTVMAIVNALYYRADWLSPFEEDFTYDDVFHSPAEDLSVPTIHSQIETHYWRGTHFGAVRIPLVHGDYFWLYLPDEGCRPEDVLTDPAFQEIMKGQKPAEPGYQEARLHFPTFDIEANSDLTDLLPGVGIENIFNPSKADFSELVEEKEEIYVSSAPHLCRLAVDNNGILGAAITEMDLSATGSPDEEPDYLIVDFFCDRPFVFAVASEKGLVFFEGIICDPSVSQ